MKTPYTLAIMSAIFMLLNTTQVLARGGGFSYDDTKFWLADTNHNQFIDRREAQSGNAQGLAQVYDQVDEDGDGRISKPEFSAFINGRGSYEPKPKG